MTLRKILEHFQNRISEAVKAAIMIGIGIQVMIEPTATYNAFRFLTTIMSIEHIATFFMFVGVARLLALIANGNFPEYGPWIRAIGAFLGSLVWSQMFLSLVALTPQDSGSLGAPVFFVFSVVEFLSIYRALGTRYRHGGNFQQSA